MRQWHTEGGDSLPSSCMLMNGLIIKGRDEKSGVGETCSKVRDLLYKFWYMNTRFNLYNTGNKQLFIEVEISL